MVEPVTPVKQDTNNLKGRPQFKSESKVDSSSSQDRKTTTDLSATKGLKPAKKREVACFNCQEKDHRVTDCPKPKKQCSACKWYGRTVENCTRGKDKKMRSEAQAKKALTDDTNRDQGYVECRINDVLFVAFVDSGSDMTMIREATAGKLQLMMRSKKILPIRGYANVLSGEIIGEVTANLVLGEFAATVVLHVVRNNMQEEDIDR